MRSENMTVIINIQQMSKIIGNEISFEKLEGKTYSEFHSLQNELIPLYNEALNRKE